MKAKEKIIFVVSWAVLVCMFLISICLGKYRITVGQIADICFGRRVPDMVYNVFINLRLPRTIMAVLSGISLGVASGIYQMIFKNPLAAPDLIGVSAGANAGAAFLIVFFHVNVLIAAMGSFVGGLIAVFVVIGISGLVKYRTSATYVMVGIAVKALSDAFIMSMKYLADPEKELASIDYWAMGSLANITPDKLKVTIPLFLFACMVLWMMKWQVNMLVLDDDEARSLGVRVHEVRIVILVAVTLLVASTNWGYPDRNL
ncbi:FecCD family ABC transporter permease [Clostridium sp. C105KSO13]|uniref:FecCD family ABC transporter permease n=1 Tax=Clostridium sp. C105KSO13 TaxID=1776045 RepID=UPI0007405EA6|nr:iron ABC transporter permease [Clostridium sp. C105KSO13]CUX20576.1 Hemin transport system permease protein HmuU [Clostridium sp. C105KSO13]